MICLKNIYTIKNFNVKNFIIEQKEKEYKNSNDDEKKLQ